MATTPPRTSGAREVEYPTSDGKPMAETDVHRDDMVDLIQALQDHFAGDPAAYISGNLLMYYEEGNPRKHVAPDVLFARGIPKHPPRLHYLVWKEGKAPDLVVEITSKSTRAEDQKKKLALYRDVLGVAEYFLFDPFEEYLRPPMQGYRLERGAYVAIEPVAGRLPSAVLGLHLERQGTALRLYDPGSGRRLPTRLERAARAETERQAAEMGRQAAEMGRQAAEVGRQAAEAGRQAAEAEAGRLRREIDDLRRRLGEGTEAAPGEE